MMDTTFLGCTGRLFLFVDAGKIRHEKETAEDGNEKSRMKGTWQVNTTVDG